jgi:hypothetical protein
MEGVVKPQPRPNRAGVGTFDSKGQIPGGSVDACPRMLPGDLLRIARRAQCAPSTIDCVATGRAGRTAEAEVGMAKAKFEGRHWCTAGGLDNGVC